MLRVALVGPLSGTFGWVGESVLRGATAALGADVVRLVPLDTAQAAGELASSAEEIADAGDISAVIGPTFSREVEAMGPALSRAGVPFVLPLATKPELGEQGWPCFFRIVASDTARGNLTARFILGALDSIRPAVTSERSQSAQRAAGRVAAALEQAGVRPQLAPALDRETEEVGVVAAAVMAMEADALFYAGEYRETALLRRELSLCGYQGSFIADEGALTRDFVETCTPEFAEGVFSVGPGAPSASLFGVGLALDSVHQAFIAEGYQCGSLLREAIQRVGAERIAISRYLRAFDGHVAGRAIQFSPAGENVHQTLFVYRVRSGEWKHWADVSNDTTAYVDKRVVVTEGEEHGVG